MAVVAPAPFGRITTRAQARTEVMVFRQLSNNITKFDTFLQELPNNYTFYINKAARTNTERERSAVSAELISNILMNAAPAVAQFYILSQKFVTAAREAIVANVAALRQLRYDNYLPAGSKCEDPAAIDLYNTAITSFRAGLVARGITLDQEFVTQQGQVVVNLAVGDQAAAITNMLARMIRKRQDQLGAAGAGAEHLEEVRQVLAGDWGIDFMFSFVDPLRKADGFGATKVQNVWVDTPGTRALLLSSALAKDQQLGGQLLERVKQYVDDADNVEGPNYDMLSRAVVEADNFLNPAHEDAGEGAGFMSQRSNIDPLFLTFYIAFHVLNLSVSDFYNWQRAIYTAGRKIRGKTNMGLVLRGFNRFPGVELMMTKLSQSTEMHCPPWVLNTSRIYDIVACIGICDCKNVAVTITNPGVSWRYFFNIRAENRSLLPFLTAIDTVEGGPQSGDEEIIQAEKILYQFIVGRDSPLSNTNGINGNALDVVIV